MWVPHTQLRPRACTREKRDKVSGCAVCLGWEERDHSKTCARDLILQPWPLPPPSRGIRNFQYSRLIAVPQEFHKPQEPHLRYSAGSFSLTTSHFHSSTALATMARQSGWADLICRATWLLYHKWPALRKGENRCRKLRLPSQLQ